MIIKISRKDLEKIGNKRVMLGGWYSTKTVYKSITEERFFIHRSGNEYLEITWDTKYGIYVNVKHQ